MHTCETSEPPHLQPVLPKEPTELQDNTFPVSHNLSFINRSSSNMVPEPSRLLYATNNAHCFNTSNLFNVSTNHNIVINTGIDNEKHHILRWLSPLEPQQRHQAVRTERLDGMGGWLLETDKFLKWSNSDIGDESLHAVLFCSGNPGVGKTYLR